MEAFTGMLACFGFNFAPRDWSLCAGQLIAISQNSALFSLLGTQFGGNGRTIFGLPDLRGRLAIGMGQGPGLPPYTIGMKDGQPTRTLGLPQLPTHTHTAVFTPSGGGGSVEVQASQTPASKPLAEEGDYIASDNPIGGLARFVAESDAGVTVPLGGVSGGGGGGGAVTVNDTGASQPFEILQPCQVINWSICQLGLYPPRG